MGLRRTGRESDRIMGPADDRGFSLVEVVVAILILTTALLALAGMFTVALSRTMTSSWDILAKEKASETIETILAARDAGRLTWDQIRNEGQGVGVFQVGPKPLLAPGPDRLINTTDDVEAEPLMLERPGPNGNMFDADDEMVPLTMYTREILIQTAPNTPGDTLREIRVIIRYQVGGSMREVQMSSYVSSFAG